MISLQVYPSSTILPLPCPLPQPFLLIRHLERRTVPSFHYISPLTKTVCFVLILCTTHTPSHSFVPSSLILLLLPFCHHAHSPFTPHSFPSSPLTYSFSSSFLPHTHTHSPSLPPLMHTLSLSSLHSYTYSPSLPFPSPPRHLMTP